MIRTTLTFNSKTQSDHMKPILKSVPIILGLVFANSASAAFYDGGKANFSFGGFFGQNSWSKDYKDISGWNSDKKPKSNQNPTKGTGYTWGYGKDKPGHVGWSDGWFWGKDWTNDFKDYGKDKDHDTPPPNPVPLPAGVWLLGSALVGLVTVSRRRLAAAR